MTNIRKNITDIRSFIVQNVGEFGAAFCTFVNQHGPVTDAFRARFLFSH